MFDEASMGTGVATATLERIDESRSGTALPSLRLPEPENANQAHVFAHASPDPERLILFADQKGGVFGIDETGRPGAQVATYKTQAIGTTKLIAMIHDGFVWICRINPDLVRKDARGLSLMSFTRDRPAPVRAPVRRD